MLDCLAATLWLPVTMSLRCTLPPCAAEVEDSSGSGSSSSDFLSSLLQQSYRVERPGTGEMRHDTEGWKCLETTFRVRLLLPGQMSLQQQPPAVYGWSMYAASSACLAAPLLVVFTAYQPQGRLVASRLSSLSHHPNALPPSAPKCRRCST